MTHGASRAWGAATVVAAVVGAAGAIATLPTPDVTWLLHVTGRVLDGARLGVDVVENSPPVIIWLKMPAVLLARATDWDSWIVWVAAVALLGVMTLIASGLLLRRIPSLAASTGILLAAIGVGLFLLPGQSFGQREHVAICLVLPWLLALVARLEGAGLPARWAWPLALAGGLGVSIKPHFALVWLAIAGVALWRRRSLSTLLLPELAGAALVPALAILGTLVLHPEWAGYARLYGPLYRQFERESPLWVGLVGEGVEWSWLGLLAFLAFRSTNNGSPASSTVLVAGLIGFHLAAALQMKGWAYHFLPAGTLGLAVAVTTGAEARWPQDRLVRRVYRVATPLGVMFAAVVGSWRAAHLVSAPDFKWTEADPSLPRVLAEVRRSGRRETLLVLSTNIGAGFPLSHLARAEWTMRHPSLWVLGAIYENALRDSGLVETPAPTSWTQMERRMVQELDDDVARHPPTIVMIPEAMPDAPGWAASQRFRYATYLNAVEGIQATGCLDVDPVSIEAYLVWKCR